MVLIPLFGKPIYAHEKVLSAGCESLRDGHAVCVNKSAVAKHQGLLKLVRCHASSILLSCLPMLLQDNVIPFGGARVSQASFEAAIKHMYGFKFKGVGNPPHTLLDIAEVATIAEELEITGLFELVSKIADSCVIDCSDNEAKLRNFLCLGRFYGRGVQNGEHIFQPFATHVLGVNFFELNNTEALHDLFYWVPNLARAVLRYLGDNHHSEKCWSAGTLTGNITAFQG